MLAAAIKCKHCGSSIESASTDSEEIIEMAGDKSEATDSTIMEKYGISFQNGMYVFQSYRYEKLSDAINYAKRQLGG